MRDKTERPEGIKAGVCKLVGTSTDSIVSAVTHLLDDRRAYRKFGSRRNPFGDGTAAKKIVASIPRILSGSQA